MCDQHPSWSSASIPKSPLCLILISWSRNPWVRVAWFWTSDKVDSTVCIHGLFHFSSVLCVVTCSHSVPHVSLSLFIQSIVDWHLNCFQCGCYEQCCYKYSCSYLWSIYSIFCVIYFRISSSKKFRDEIEMLTSQKCGGLICPFDSLKKQNRITPPKKKTVKLTSSLWPNNSTPGYLSKRNENTSPQEPATRMFLTVLFIITPNWKQSKCLSTEEWINKLGLFTQWTPLSRGRKYWAMDGDKPPKQAEWPKPRHLHSRDPSICGDWRLTWRSWRGFGSGWGGWNALCLIGTVGHTHHFYASKLSHDATYGLVFVPPILC